MTFILDEQRQIDVVNAFDRYRAYLVEKKDVFPTKAYKLATSDWYFNFGDIKCPHDAWLEKVEIVEHAEGEREEYRSCSIVINLLNAFHNGKIKFIYNDVHSYSLSSPSVATGHDDWRYDEFRVNDKGRLIHEIEWTGYGGQFTWVIEAEDVEYEFFATYDT